jgi:uncharacterized membrane protein YbhN (UPF0104 family)
MTPPVQSDAPPEETALPSAPRRPSRLRGLLIFAFELACIGYVARVLWRERAELASAFDLELTSLLVLFVLMGVAHLQRAYEFTYMLRRLGVREPFGEGFLLTGAGFLLNHLPFNAGLVMRATVLKRDHALPYTSYLSLVAVNALVSVATASALGLVTVLMTRPFVPATALPLLGLFGVMLVGALLALWAPRSWVPAWEGYVGRRLRAFVEGSSKVRGNVRELAWLACLSSAKIAVAGVRMWICFGALGQDVSFLAAGLLASMTIVLSLVNVTPGNLGLRELVLAGLATALGTSYAVGMAAASVDRVVLLAYTVVAGVPGLFTLRRRGPFKP